MNTNELVYEYLQKRRELTEACAQPMWKSCRAGHVQRVSRELAQIEDALEATDIDAAIFSSMIVGRLDGSSDTAPRAAKWLAASAPEDARSLPSFQSS